jgi:hypothetical protein
MNGENNASSSGERSQYEENDRLHEIHDQLLKRVLKALKAEFIPQICDARPRIPKPLLPSNLKENVVMDVTLLKGELLRRVIISPQGYVVGSELIETGIVSFDEGSVYAVRVRSGFLGRLCLRPWHCICE